MKQFFSRLVAACLLLGLMACQPTDNAVETVEHAADSAYDADISYDGRWSVVATFHHHVALWDLHNNALKYRWKHGDHSEDTVLLTRFSTDGSTVITADEKRFALWDVTTGQSRGFYQAPARIRSVALSDRAAYAALGLTDGRIIHINLASGRRIEFVGHGNEKVYSVDLSANGRYLLSGANDYRAVLWDAQTGKPIFVWPHQTRVIAVALHASGKYAFTSGTMGNAFVWDLQSGAIRTKLALKPREYVITTARFNRDGSLLLTGAPRKEVRLWDPDTGQPLQQFTVKARDQWRPRGAVVYAVGFSDDEQYALSEASSGFGQKWLLEPSAAE